MIAPACSAALPTIGSKIMLRKLTDKPHELDASCSISHTFSSPSADIITDYDTQTPKQ